MGAAARTAVVGPRPRPALRAGVAVAAVELVLVLLGWRTEQFLLPIAGALGLLFALLAYRTPEAAWLLVWVVTPFSTETRIAGGFAMAVPTEPMIVIALGAWIAREWPCRRPTIGTGSLARPLLTLAAIALVSVFASHHLWIGLKAWVVAALYAAFGYAYFVSTGLTTRLLTRFLALGVAAAVAVATYASARVIASGLSLSVSYGAARPFFPEHGTFAAYVAFFLPVALLEGIARQGRARVPWIAAAAVLSLGIVLSLTRAAWLSALVVIPLSLVGWVVARGLSRQLWTPVALALLLGAGVAVTGAGDRLWGHARSMIDTENISNLERLNRWMAAAEMVKARPWTGVGYGAYPDAYRGYRRKAIVTHEVYGYFGAHNELIRLVAETGWPGLGAGLWFVAAAGILGVRSFLRDPGSDRARLVYGVTCGLATYAIHGVFNSYLGMDKISVPFWVFLGMIAAAAPGSRGAGSRSSAEVS